MSERVIRYNNGFSGDEQYVACLIDCTLAGGVSDEVIGREKVQRILTAKPAYSRLRGYGTRTVNITQLRVINRAWVV